MDKYHVPPISIEQFAAYLDGNLDESGMNEVDSMIATDSALNEIASASDIIDEEYHFFIQDDFAYDAEMSVWHETDIEIPTIDVLPSHDLESSQLELNDIVDSEQPEESVLSSISQPADCRLEGDSPSNYGIQNDDIANGSTEYIGTHMDSSEIFDDSNISEFGTDPSIFTPEDFF